MVSFVSIMVVYMTFVTAVSAYDLYLQSKNKSHHREILQTLSDLSKESDLKKLKHKNETIQK